MDIKNRRRRKKLKALASGSRIVDWKIVWQVLLSSIIKLRVLLDFQCYIPFNLKKKFKN